VEAHLPEHRERLYPPTTTLSLFLAQVLNNDASCQGAVNIHTVERVFSGLSPSSSKTGGYCRARQRLPREMVSALVKQTGYMMSEQTPAAWKWQGRRIKLVDGTTIPMPDTLANQEVFPQQKRQEPGLGLPISRMVAIVCLSTGVVLNAAMGPLKGKGSSEYFLFLRLLDTLGPGDIVLADRYYCSSI